MKSALRKVGVYLELSKPRITALVVLTTAAGFYLAGGSEPFDWLLLFHTLAGTALIAGGTSVLNQVMEKENDGRMRRTEMRPLPARKIGLGKAAAFGLTLVGGATVYLALQVNGLVAFLGFLTSFVYLLVYTPLKTRTSICTTIGAFSGATPPLMGWAAVRGELDYPSLLLFLILFFWQFPHFLAIAWIYREDYERGGFRMLPLLDEGGHRTAARVVLFNAVLLIVSVLPTLMGLTGAVYLIGAIVLGTAFLWSGVLLARARNVVQARHLLRASIVYLPLLLVLMVADKA